MTTTTANTAGRWFHVLAAAILLIGTIILISMAHSASDILKKTDFVTLYTYKKAVVNRDKALVNLTAANKASTFWLSDKLDTKHCLDMSFYAYPTVSFTPGMDPTSPTCQISFGVATTATQGQVQISAVYTGDVASCAPGTYPLQINQGSGVVATVPNLIITPKTETINGSAQLGFDLSVSGSFGYNYATYNDDWTACRNARRALADQYLTNTSCETEASPMCTCVRSFTDKIVDWNTKLKYEPKAGIYLEDVLLAGVGRCMDLRRAHDVPVPIEQKYARSRPLLIFALTLLLNAVYFASEGFVERHIREDRRWMAQAAFLLTLFVAALLACLLDAESGAAGEWRTMLTMLLPAFAVHGLYEAIAEGMFRPEGPTPFMHPVAFDLCLGALTLFTLVERGVVQSEYLIVELLKVHAVAALYMGITWYHRNHGAKAGGVAIYESPYVQQAYLLLWLVGMGAAFDTSLVPYPSKKGWELHWLLPVAFTFWGFASPSWFHSLPISTRLGGGPGAGVISAHSDLTGLIAFLFGALLWGYALRTHIQVYGAQHYAYPSVDDLSIPLSTKFH
jgi:hypothetical protein